MSSVAFLGPQNVPKLLAAGASTDPLAEFNGPISKGRRGNRRGGEEKGGRRNQNDLCPGRQKLSCRHCKSVVHKFHRKSFNVCFEKVFSSSLENSFSSLLA